MGSPSPRASACHRRITADDIASMDRHRRIHFVNSLPGYKSANLIATRGRDGIANVAILSSVIHLGSDPPLLGFIQRPLVVTRHTYDNLSDTKHFTVNAVSDGMVVRAHQTSAKYPAQVSEFEACDLAEESCPCGPAPYVAESSLSVSLAFEEQHPIQANGTLLVVGRVQEVVVRRDILGGDGLLDHEAAGTVAVSGADAYHGTFRLARLGKAELPPEPPAD